ncbi:energy transducer TonB [Aurantivibrio plasticivorans]
MENTILWQLLDTSLKIGLGALIAGVCAWLLVLRRHTPEMQSRLNRRMELFEEVSRNVGAVNHIFAKYSSLIIESTRFGLRWPQARKDELDRVNAELVAEFNKLADAEAKLLMLGEKGMEKTLRFYGAKIAYFRKHVYVGRQDISDEEITQIKRDITKLREQFYDMLSRKYDRLLAAS